MAALSILLPGGVAVALANPVHPVSEVDLRDGATLAFEVLDADSSSLKRLIGKVESFVFESHVFCGELLSLERCEPTVGALLAFEKPVMRGVLRIHKTLNPEDESN